MPAAAAAEGPRARAACHVSHPSTACWKTSQARAGRASEGLIIPEDGPAQKARLLAGEHEDGGGRCGGLQVGALLGGQRRERVFVAQEIMQAGGARAGIEPCHAPGNVLFRSEM